jgi:very-short-patch-repair endonuclease
MGYEVMRFTHRQLHDRSRAIVRSLWALLEPPERSAVPLR